MTNSTLINEFETILTNTNRVGIDDLIEFLRKSDFYKAPASTRFHSCHEGGLLEHSMNVYKCLIAKRKSPMWANQLASYSDETLAIVSLLHDLGKCYQYGVEMRNKKDETGKWVQVPFYTVDDKYPMPHATKSLVFVTQFISLNMAETIAIVSHMGFSEPSQLYGSIGGAFKKYKLALALHEADLEATYLLEEEK